jgi:membrane protein DedA with SNARE-associated domain
MSCGSVSFISDFFGIIANFVLATIGFLGYGGVFVMMVLESMVFPAPSELIMPFAGYIASQGTFNLILVIVVSTLGSIVGSLLSYYIGKRWGTKLVIRYGKYILVSEEELHRTEDWFDRHGEITVFVFRLVPVIRHLISLVAGLAEMDVKKFALYTIAGAAIWNSIMAYLGFYLGNNWHLITQYADELSLAIVLLIVIAVVWFIVRHIVKRRRLRQNA